MKTLESIQQELREMTKQGNDLGLAALKKIIKPDTPRFQELKALEDRFRDIGKQLIEDVITAEHATAEYASFKQSLFDFIDSLKKTDVPQEEKEATSGGIADVYNGEVLYRIPKKMAVGVEEECVVRLAFDRKLLLQDFDVKVGDVVKDLRIADVMGVELIDPNSDKAFTVTTVYDTVQIVEKDLVTEWIFCVTPLREGSYPLVLKISIIEIINGIERKRNEVLKESVLIQLTLDPTDLKPDFQKGYTWQVVDADEQVAIAESGAKAVQPERFPPVSPSPQVSPPPAPAPQPATPRATKALGLGLIGKVIAGVMALVIGTVAVKQYILPNKTSPEVAAAEERSNRLRSLRANPNRQELEAFFKSNEGTTEATVAMTVLDSLENEIWQSALAMNDAQGIENYLREYPDGRYSDKAALLMDEINRQGEIIAVITDSLGLDSIEIIKDPVLPTKPADKTTKPVSPNKKPSNNVKPTQKPPTKPSTKPQTPPAKPPTETKPPTKPPVDPNAPVSMVSAARRPVFKNCGNSNKTKEEKCTTERIYRHLKSRIEYPQEAMDKKIEGTVVVSFVVERDGSITDVKALNDIGGGCAKEAVRLVKSLPKFKSGMNGKGDPIRVQYTQPVTFKLQ